MESSQRFKDSSPRIPSPRLSLKTKPFHTFRYLGQPEAVLGTELRVRSFELMFSSSLSLFIEFVLDDDAKTFALYSIVDMINLLTYFGHSGLEDYVKCTIVVLTPILERYKRENYNYITDMCEDVDSSDGDNDRNSTLGKLLSRRNEEMFFNSCFANEYNYMNVWLCVIVKHCDVNNKPVSHLQRRLLDSLGMSGNVKFVNVCGGMDIQCDKILSLYMQYLREHFDAMIDSLPPTINLTKYTKLYREKDRDELFKLLETD